MRYLLLLLLAGCAQGQLPVVPLPQLAPVSSSTTPGTLGARYWWVSSDKTVNLRTTNWIDRIQGLALTNTTSDASSPTNSSTGIGFDGTTWFTNKASPAVFIGTPDGSGPTGTLWVVVSPQTPSTTAGLVGNDKGYGLLFTAGGAVQFAGNDGTISVTTFSAGTVYDITLVKTNQPTVGNPNLQCYRNAVLTAAADGGDFGPDGFNLLGRAMNGFGFYKGKVLEVAFFYSNLTQTVVSQLHTYATNTYGYSP